MKKISGTREWAVTTANCVQGCNHDCKYCYARYNACNRFHRLDKSEWHNMSIREKDVNKKRNKVDGTIMFPSTHDICPEVLEPCVTVIGKILNAGNDILIVSKPHLECIKRICKEFVDFRKNILFRFTIGARDSKILSYWEPNAPDYEERFESLVYAYKNGFKTSVSCEPMLDSPDIINMVREMEPFVTDSIWIGKMNKIHQRVSIETDEDEKMVSELREGQRNHKIFAIFNELKDNKKVKWKESIKEVVGIDLQKNAGMDV